MSNSSACQRKLRAGYFRYRYFFFRRKIACLLLTMAVVVLLHVATHTLVITHTVARHADKRASTLQAPSRSHEPHTPKPPPEWSEIQEKQEQETQPGNGQTFSHEVRASTDSGVTSSTRSRDKDISLFQSTPKQNGEVTALVTHNRSDMKPGATTRKPQDEIQSTRNRQIESKPEEKETAITQTEDPQARKERDKKQADEREKTLLLNEVMMQREYQENQPDHEAENFDGEAHRVFFLKVHKAASTTVMNIMYRFAIKRNLDVLLPRRGNVFSETNKYWLRTAMTQSFGRQFDVLCNHLVFSEQAVRMSLGADAKFIGIVREPFEQFISAFFYYRNVFQVRYLSRIPGEDPVATYLEEPYVFESRKRTGSLTHNRMSFDFGMSPSMMTNHHSIDMYIRYLNRTFDLVMISERFDESMVLMKRLLGWRLQDVLYIKNNVFTKTRRHRNYTSEQKRAHKMFNSADYKLHKHFSDVFQTRVEQEGKLFKEEVATFVSLREKVEQFCQESKAETITLNATDWTPGFEVSRLDCRLMILPEVPFVSIMRARQYGSRMMHAPELINPFPFVF